MAISLRYSAPGRIIPESYLERGGELLLLFACLFSVGFFQPQFVVQSTQLAELDLNLFIEDRSGSNLFNQVKWLLLAGIGGVLVMLRTDRFLRLCALCWPLLLLMAVALMTVFWSVDPASTMRRGIRSLIFVFVVLSAMAYVRDWKRALVIVYLAYWALLLQNLAGFAIPGSFDLFGNYTGATSQKNQLGILAAVGVLIGVWARMLLEAPLHRAINLFYLACWLGLMALSFSKTALALVLVTPMVLVGFIGLAKTLRLSIGTTVFLVMSCLFLTLGLIHGLVGMTPLDLVRLINKDVTFTGRTEIWGFLYDKLQDRLLGGFGFGAFWGQGMDSPSLTAPYPYIWYLDSAHNAYLEIVANCGLIGLAAMGLVLVHFSVAADQAQRRDHWFAYAVWWIVIFILSHSMMESSLLRPTETGMWFLFVFVYLATLRFVGDGRLGEADGGIEGMLRQAMTSPGDAAASSR